MLRRLTSLALLFALVASLPNTAWARRYGYGGGGGGGTVFGSQAAGMGALIRAQGAYNQMTAQAMVVAEQAKKAALDNKLKVAQTYYQLRRMNEAEQAEQKRKELAMYAPAPPVKIPRLTSDQLDPVTGKITWPQVLDAKEFDAERGALENMFALRAIDPSSVTNSQVEKLTFALRDKLDAEHDHYSTTDFFTARHFLESLDAESRNTGLENHPDVVTK